MANYPEVAERLIRYCEVASQSDPHNEVEVPSAPRELEMAAVLAADLRELGASDVRQDSHAYVTAQIPASAGAEHLPALGLIAHLDTSPDAPAEGVRPQVVRYEGGALVAGEVDGARIETTPEQCPYLDEFIGEDIVCTDGRTLLGADDKAGVAAIMTLAHRLLERPALPHPRIAIAFVPDEEIGHGAELLDLEQFGAAWAYTVDGEELGEFNYECFNARAATVRFHGVVTHPGTAKDKMVNAISLTAEFLGMLPAAESPEHTEGREGFYHPMEIEGTTAEASLAFILRDFDTDGIEAREQRLRAIAAFMNARYGEGTVDVEVQRQYRNMAEHFADQPFLVQNALAAYEAAGVEPRVVPVRGGTDGAQLTFRGLPCPNIATGATQIHSVREFVPVRALETTVDILQHLVALFAVEQRA